MEVAFMGAIIEARGWREEERRKKQEVRAVG
jgi:hypothetical protein